MASQQIPVSYQPLVKLLAQAADGARSHGAAVGLKQNIEAVLRPELEAIIGPSGSNQGPPATPSLKARWNAAKAYKVDASSRLLVAKADGRGLALACVNALKARLGLRWSNVWQAAGFTAGSLRVPEDPLTTLQQLRDYFTTHPDHELPNLSPVFGATAASCHAAAEAIIAATTELNEKTVAASDAKTQLDDALRSARQRLGGLREELSRRGFTEFADFTAGQGTALLARKRGRT